MTVEKANKVGKSRGSRPLFDEEDKKGDFQQLLEHVQANPALYAAGALIVVLVVLAGLIYRANTASKQRDFMTKYATALESEDSSIRAVALEPLAAGKDDLAAQALYMLGESAYQAQQYDKSKAAYERLRSEFPNSPNTPSAVEGLGYIAENKGDYQAALGVYKEVLDKWPATFAGRRQNLNIGRCDEALNKFEEAKAAYDAQLTAFAGSSIYNDAKAALDRLRLSHPNLFPADTAAKTDTKAETPTPGAEKKIDAPAAAPAATPAPATPESAPPTAPVAPAAK